MHPSPAEPRTDRSLLEAMLARLAEMQERIRLALNLVPPDERRLMASQVAEAIMQKDPDPGSSRSQREFPDLYGRLRRLDPQHDLFTRPARQLADALQECREATAALDAWKAREARHLDPRDAQQMYTVIRREMLRAPVHDLADVAPQHPFVQDNADLLTLRAAHPGGEHPSFWRAVAHVQFNPEATPLESSVVEAVRDWVSARADAGEAPTPELRLAYAEEARHTQVRALEPAVADLAELQPDHPLVAGYTALLAGQASREMLRYEGAGYPEGRERLRQEVLENLSRLAGLQPFHPLAERNAPLFRDDPAWQPAYTVSGLLQARELIQHDIDGLRSDACPWTPGKLPEEALRLHHDAASLELKELVPCLRHIAGLQPDHPWVQWGRSSFPFADMSPIRPHGQAGQEHTGVPVQARVAPLRSGPDPGDGRER